MIIVHFITSTGVGGAQIMLKRYLAALGPEAKNHSVVCLTGIGSIGRDIQNMGVHVESLGLKPGRVSLSAIAKMRKMLRQQPVSVVHAWMYHGCLASIIGLAGRFGKKPGLVWGVHHSLQDIKKEKFSSQMIIRIMAALSGSVGRITYCSDVSRNQHEAIGFNAKKSALIPNAVDTSEFKPDPAARDRLIGVLGIPGDRLMVGNVSRSHPMKDHVSMVRATAKMLEEGHNVQAVLIGEGHTGSAAAVEAQSLGIADRVSILEMRHDIARLVPGLDVFLLSSAWGEAFPLAVTEAMSAEVPCVVTDVGDCAKLVGDTGTVVPPSDANAQASAVGALLSAGEEERARLGRAARLRVQDNFSMNQYVQLHREAYHSVQSGRPQAAHNIRSMSA
ncbi:glycosyltransferase [uncultured Roseobacter sp.]|uniref:glycosyltransferase n=1 Tax=uncultured Roseobacter sp. TaxID=114847 RepID=UPI002602227D|nr:glycosyltransferase [uncultured Roseobacter sp.]